MVGERHWMALDGSKRALGETIVQKSSIVETWLERWFHTSIIQEIVHFFIQQMRWVAQVYFGKRSKGTTKVVQQPEAARKGRHGLYTQTHTQIRLHAVNWACHHSVITVVAVLFGETAAWMETKDESAALSIHTESLTEGREGEEEFTSYCVRSVILTKKSKK